MGSGMSAAGGGASWSQWPAPAKLNLFLRITGRRADALKAAWTAAEVAMRLVKVGNKNWQVTDAVNRVAAAWDCKAVEGQFPLATPSPFAVGSNY